jgi:hypothetical protein
MRKMAPVGEDEVSPVSLDGAANCSAHSSCFEEQIPVENMRQLVPMKLAEFLVEVLEADDLFHAGPGDNKGKPATERGGKTHGFFQEPDWNVLVIQCANDMPDAVKWPESSHMGARPYGAGGVVQDFGGR